MSVIRKCKNCNKDFTYSPQLKWYCSKQCKIEKIDKSKKPLLIKHCILCEKKFFTRRKTAKTCSTKCFKISRLKQKQNKKCKECGDLFLASKINQLYCSTSCSRKITYRKNSKNPKYIIHKRMSSNILQTLKKGQKNGRRWEQLVGYSTHELIKHLKNTIEEPYKWKFFISGR